MVATADPHEVIMSEKNFVVVPVDPAQEMILASSRLPMMRNLPTKITLGERIAIEYREMLKAAPNTGMVAVRRDLLQKMWSVLEKEDSFNSFSAEEEREMIDALSAG